MPEFTFELPAGGEPRNTSDAKIKTALTKLKEPTLDNTNLSASAGVKDTQLASPNNGAYRLLSEAGLVRFAADAAAGTYFLRQDGSIIASPAEFTLGGSNTIRTTYFDDADYVVASKTQKLRIRFQVAANGTKPTIKFTAGLYPVTVSGGADIMIMTAGTVVAGSTVEINEPAASTITSGVGSDFTIPADGSYVLALVTSGTLTNNSAVAIAAQLQTRSV